MIIKVLLIASFVLVTLKFLANPSSSQMRASKKLLGLGFVAAAIVSILWPQLSTDVAHAVGVGRGADLLLYIMSVAFILVCFNLYVVEQRERRRQATLVRRVALLEAEVNKLSLKK